jgi:lactate dehydrogenase-like 2-hydroxyacid dehydrogenase
MGNRKIVITGATFPAQVERELRAGNFDVEMVPGDLDESGVIAALQGAWGFVLGGSERMSKDAWAQLPELRIVCFLGTGYGSFIEVIPTTQSGHLAQA